MVELAAQPMIPFSQFSLSSQSFLFRYASFHLQLHVISNFEGRLSLPSKTHTDKTLLSVFAGLIPLEGLGKRFLLVY